MDAAYRHNMYMHEIFGALQVSLLTITVFISIFKPWKGKNKPDGKNRTAMISAGLRRWLR